MTDNEKTPNPNPQQKESASASPFALKEPPAFKPPSAGSFNINAPPPFSLKPSAPATKTADQQPAFASPPTFAQQQQAKPAEPSHPPPSGYPVVGYPTSPPTQPMQPMQPMRPMQPVQPTHHTQPIHPPQGYPQPQHPSSSLSAQPHHPPPMGFATQQAPKAPTPQNEGQQILAKLQQFMNQMNSFMKSVDARLTTLEKMVQQVATVQNQQSQVLDSVRASAHPPPSHAPSHAPSHTPSHAPSHPPPADLPREQNSITPPPYLPDAAPSATMPDFRSPTTSYGGQKTRQELDDEEMAKRLQQEFNMEAQKSEVKRAVSEPSATAETEECPICHTVLPLKDLELHVQACLTVTEGKPSHAEPTHKPTEKSLWDRIFGANEETDASQNPQQPTAMYPYQGVQGVQYGSPGAQGVQYGSPGAQPGQGVYYGQTPGVPQGYGYFPNEGR